MNIKKTVINGKYTLVQENKNLKTNILDNDKQRYDNVECCLQENHLNHWIDSQQSNGTWYLETILNDNESTLQDIKDSSVRLDLMDFRDEMLPVFQAFLKFAYYEEKNEQWKTPFDPLNLIYSKDEQGQGHIKAFYREPKVLGDSNSDFLNDVVTMCTYLFYPKELQKPYYEVQSGQELLEDLEKDINFESLDEADDYIDFVVTCLSPSGSSYFSSVKDIMENVGDRGYLEVENKRNSVVPEKYSQDVVNLNDYQSAPAEKVPSDKEPESNRPLTKKELKEQKQRQRQQELERRKQELAEKEKQKKLEKQRKKELRKQKQKKVPIKKAPSKLSQPKEPKQDGPKAKKSKKGIIAGVAAIAILGGGAYYMHKQNQASQQQAAQTKVHKSSAKHSDPMNDADFRKGVEQSGSGNYAGAVKSFNDYFADHTDQSLNNQEVSTVFKAYLQTGNYQSILDNIGNSETATALVDYLVAKNQLDKIKSLDSDMPIIQFAQADADHDYQKMIDLSDQVPLKKNSQMEDDLCNAFAQTNQLSKGKEWAETKSNASDLINSIKAHAYQANKESHDDIDKQLS